MHALKNSKRDIAITIALNIFLFLMANFFWRREFFDSTRPSISAPLELFSLLTVQGIALILMFFALVTPVLVPRAVRLGLYIFSSVVLWFLPFQNMITNIYQGVLEYFPEFILNYSVIFFLVIGLFFLLGFMIYIEVLDVSKLIPEKDSKK